MKIEKILIGSEETCGIIGQFSEYYKTKGYHVVTVAKKSKFFHYQYDIDPDNFIPGWFNKTQKSFFVKQVVKLLIKWLPKKYGRALLWRLKRNFLGEFDLYINVWDCFLYEELAMKYARQKGVKWMTICMGDDFRNRWVFQNNFDVDDNLLPGVKKTTTHLIDKMKRIRLHEKYADILFSAPDQSSLSLRPYYHAYAPVDLSETTFCVPKNKKLRIIHCPSNSNAKGTVIIEAVVNEIISEGADIEFLSLHNIPHLELMNLLSGADILIDELVFHGPCYLSFEAMASGCAVLTKIFEDTPEKFKSPNIPVTRDNLKSKLIEIINDKERIVELAMKGREFVEEKNSLPYIADYYLDCLFNRKDFDYYPEYFRNNFDPETYGLDKSIVNESIASVRECSWYKENVKTGDRIGLNF